MPFETMSLPTNATWRSRPEARSSRWSARPAAASSRAKASFPATESVPARRVASAVTSAAASPRGRGRNSSMSTPGGPSRVRAGRPSSSIAAHRLSAVWREPTRTVRARSRPSRAAGRNRAGSRLTVYSSALPWTFTAYGTASPSPRARTSGPITRWLASATSGRARAATSRTATTFAAT